jgi:uncharacterized protein (TIGR03083 family)
MMWEEVTDIGELIHSLDDGAFDEPSLCTGWRVRDVLGHMALGHTTPMTAMLRALSHYRFNVPKASFEESPTFFAGKTADEIRSFWDEVMIARHPHAGISKLIPARSGFVDHLIHNQDIRRPTGHLRQIPEARLRRALQLVASEATPLFNPKRNVKGLSLQATDIDYRSGDGPVLEGPGEALVMSAAGRSSALEELSGEGVAILRARLAK